jgi:hypothetical protein
MHVKGVAKAKSELWGFVCWAHGNTKVPTKVLCVHRARSVCTTQAWRCEWCR